MERFVKSLSLALLLCCLALCLASTKLWTRLVESKPIDCATLGIENLNPSSGEVTCSARTFLFSKYRIAKFVKIPSADSLKFGLKSIPPNTTVTVQSIKPPPGYASIANKDGKTVWFTSVGTEWTGASRALANLSAGEDYTLLSKSDFEFEMVFSLGKITAKHSIFLTALSVLIGCYLFIFGFVVRTPRFADVAMIASVLALIVVWCGMPYGTTTGWIDTADDTSYLNWSYNLGYLLDPDLTHGPIKSWASHHNHHSWGTGLFLAPFLFVARLISPGLPVPGLIHFGLMNFGIIFWGCVSVYVFYWTYKLFSPWRPALLMALLGLVSTSALRWMFIRNIFSHIPELVTIGCAAYFCAQRYFRSRGDWRTFLFMMLSLIMAVQVRRENNALFGIPILYEILLPQTRSRKERLSASIALLVGIILSSAILLATNYFTELKAFFANSQTQNFFNFKTPLQTLLTVGPQVFYGQDFGLFYWQNAYPWLALLACLTQMKQWRYWLPLAGTVGFYLLLCTYFEYPNGMEWQNRFLLKLTPILFGGALWFLNHSRLPIRIAGWIWMFVGAGMELLLYRVQKPVEMPFYIDDLSDHLFMYPQSWPGMNMSIFYLPLIAISFVATLFWTLFYFMGRRRPRSSS